MKYLLLFLTLSLSLNSIAETITIKSGLYATGSFYCGYRLAQSQDKQRIIVENVDNPRLNVRGCRNQGDTYIFNRVGENTYSYNKNSGDDSDLFIDVINETSFLTKDVLFSYFVRRVTKTTSK